MSFLYPKDIKKDLNPKQLYHRNIRSEYTTEFFQKKKKKNFPPEFFFFDGIALID